MASYVTPHLDDGGRLMVTHDGTHPPDLWAQVAVEHIAPIGDITGQARLRALELQTKFMNILQEVFERLQSDEKRHLTANPDHVVSDLASVQSPMDQIVSDIQVAAVGSNWEAQFRDPIRQDLIKTELAGLFNTVAFIERSKYIDDHPDHPQAAVFIKMKTGG